MTKLDSTHTPLPPLTSTKSDLDSNPDYWINPDSDICQISTKCCGFITMSVSVILPTVVKIGRDCMRNASKSRVPQWQVKWKSDPESVSWIGSPAKVNQFCRLVTSTFNEISWLLRSDHTNRITDKPTWSHNLHLGRGKKVQQALQSTINLSCFRYWHQMALKVLCSLSWPSSLDFGLKATIAH